MEAEVFTQLSETLRALTPQMTDVTVAQMSGDPALVARYSTAELREFAQQAVVSFRDVLLGAVQFDHPRILGSELDWISKLMEGRGIDQANLRAFFTNMRALMHDNLPAQEYEAVNALMSQAIAYIHPR